MSAGIGLAALEARLLQDLEFLDLPGKEWVPPRAVAGRPVRDVVIVGAGMCGLAAAGALALLGIRDVVIYDAAPAGREGPWATYARMRTLRSPKALTGPALGLPALTFRAWFEAQLGRAAWDALGTIPRLQWMDYLVWYPPRARPHRAQRHAGDGHAGISATTCWSSTWRTGRPGATRC